MKEKDNFIIYHNSYCIIEELSNEDKGQLFDSIFKYSMNKELPQFKKGSSLSIAFKNFKNTIDINNHKYEEKCKKNLENINKRYENSNKHVFIDNEKVSYDTFQRTYVKGYKDKYGNSLSFGQIFEDQYQCYKQSGDFVLLKDKYKCSSLDKKEIEQYFQEYQENLEE